MHYPCVPGCCGYFCGMCQLCQNASALDESPVLCCLLTMLCYPIGLGMLRQKARYDVLAHFDCIKFIAKYFFLKIRQRDDIDGSLLGDLFCACCCPSCVNCQIAKQVKDD